MHLCDIDMHGYRKRAKVYYLSLTMKIMSVILIIAYLVLPAICFGHPCEILSSNSLQSTVASDASGECPFNQDTVDCETTCCCAGHVPQSVFTIITHTGLSAKLLSNEPLHTLPRLIDRIFVPPQKLS
jgi:hypothetical protein